MVSIGLGKQEIGLNESDGIDRMIYVTKFADASHVLNAFQKKHSRPSSMTLN